VLFKRAGDATLYLVHLDPRRGVVGWRAEWEHDVPGPRRTQEEAREIALAEAPGSADVDLDGWREIAATTIERPHRTDHRFTYERYLSRDPELRQRLYTTVAGETLIRAVQQLEVPPAAGRRVRSAAGPERALMLFGFAALALAAAAGLFVFLRGLREGTVSLRRAALWPAVALLLLLTTNLVQTDDLFWSWEPLWPRWISTLDTLFWNVAGQVGMILGLFVLIGAGDALDRSQGYGRGDSLWALIRGRVADRVAGLASLRGFLIGMVCGGVLAGSVLLLQAVVGAPAGIQPRGFFFYAINSASPTLSTLAYFLFVALTEELGYRFFGGTWLLTRTRRRWLAITLPALIYGLTHTGLDFLPPFEPFWGRAFTLTLVGCVWGWAFLRYDALTVVLSHYTADLFIFNWPRLASGEPATVGAAALTVAVPLLPALCWLLAGARRRLFAP
jgi:membrane protease YdiL (CAAX protease family)